MKVSLPPRCAAASMREGRVRTRVQTSRSPCPLRVLYRRHISFPPAGPSHSRRAGRPRTVMPTSRGGSTAPGPDSGTDGGGSATTVTGDAGLLPAADQPKFRYDAARAAEIELSWQERWLREDTFAAPNPTGLLSEGFEKVAGPTQVLRAGHVPVPQRRRPPRRPPARLHRHRRVRPLQADDRPQRAPRHGLRRLRAAGRAVRGADRPAPAGHDRVEHRHDAPPARAAGPGPRPPAERGDHRRLVLPLDPVDLPADLQELVRHGRRPGPPDQRARSRAGRRAPASRRRARTRRAGRGPSCPTSSAARSSTPTAWPTATRRWSTGAPAWARSWPTRRSPPTAAPSGATSRSSGGRSSSG